MESRKFIITRIREYINERNNQRNSKNFNNIGVKTEDVFDLIDWHDVYRDLYPNYSGNGNVYEEDYYFQTMEGAYNEVNNLLEFFNTLPNPITIYRSIKVKSIDDIKYDWLGDSWSFDKESAINFAKNQAGGNILLIGKTNFNNVDWKNTIKLFYQFSRTFDGYDENEINIIDSDEVFDVKAEKIKN